MTAGAMPMANKEKVQKTALIFTGETTKRGKAIGYTAAGQLADQCYEQLTLSGV